MPTSLHFSGDRNLAARYWGEGKRLLFHLKQVLGIGNLPQGQLIRHYPDGTMIRVRQVFAQDFIEIVSPPRGRIRERERKEMFVFLFFNEGQFKVYKLEIGDKGYELTEEEGLEKFPFDHTWYSVPYSESRDVSPTVIAGGENRKHYISTVLDPLATPALNAYDDYQFKAARLDLSGWLSDSMTRESPAILPALMMIHVSISPYTRMGAGNLRIGSIVQPYRQTSPEYSLVPLLDAERGIPVETEVQNSGPGAFGKRGYTLHEKGHALSWKERVYAGGSTQPSVSHNLGSGAEPWLGWFFFPWMPYLQEISAFPVLSYLPSAVETILYPVPVNPQVYTLQYIDEAGTQTVPGFLQDSASYGYNHGAGASATVPDYSTIWGVVPGGPGGAYIVGSWFNHDFSSGPFDYTMTHTYSQSKSGSASGRYHCPVGSIGNKKILNIQNDFSMSAAWTRSDVETYRKITQMVGHFYNLWSGIEHYWMNNGDYQDVSFGTLSLNTMESRSFSVTQKLMAGDVEIESLLSTLNYNYSLIDSGSGETTWTFCNRSNLPLWVDGFYLTPPGESSRAETITASMNRNISCVEVLDFDSVPGYRGGDFFMVFYKKVSISHSQANQITKTASSAPTGVSRQTQHFPFASDFGVPEESFNVIGARKVEYYLYYKVGNKTEKVKLAEFNSALAQGGSGALVHSGSGERLWGVSCQLNEDLIVYHFQKEEYRNNGTAPGYDSPMNFEDISYQGLTRLWEPKKICVGVIAVQDDMASRAGLSHELFEFDPPASDLIYSVGLHRGEKETIVEAEVE